jgi:SIR2-like protein
MTVNNQARSSSRTAWVASARQLFPRPLPWRDRLASLLSMVQDERKVVWILGAGFSVPLGGPLFRQIISPETLRTLTGWDEYTSQRRFLRPGSRMIGSDFDVGPLSDIVHACYHSGLDTKLWGDAEEFLDRLDIATSEPTGMLARDVRKCLRDMAQRPGVDADLFETLGLYLPDIIHTEAIRFVAGACSAFLVRAAQNPTVVDRSEQWDPYRRWFDQLRLGYDSVITFNYDEALDLLASYGKRKYSQRRFISPVVDGEAFAVPALQCVPIYHLHGHVRWKRVDDTIRLGEPAYVDPQNSVIGLPGQQKSALPDGLLRCVWDPAMAAIRDAEAIVFVGYRFPETDNMAKRRIIEALQKNSEGKVHVVLGANNIDTPRVQAMLEWTRAPSAVKVHPMWSQDFFPVFERDRLFGFGRNLKS